MESDIHAESISATPYTQTIATADSVPEAEVAPKVRSRSEYELPQTLLGSLGLVMGINASLALVVPSLCGAVLGWWMSGTFNLPGFALALVSFFCLFTGLTVLSEYNDYRYSLRPESKYLEEESYTAGTNLISIGHFHAGFIISAGLILIVVGLLCTLLLTLTIASWPPLFFYVICSLLLAGYMLPPPWHGYLAWGLGEVGALVGIGILQVVSAYYVQRGMVDALALLIGIPLGAFGVLVLFSRSLIRQRRDWMIRKRTFAVVLGDARSVHFFIALIVVAYASLLVVISITSLPLLLMLGLLTLPMAIGQFKQAGEILQTSGDRHHLHQVMIRVTLATGLLLMVLLIVERVF